MCCVRVSWMFSFLQFLFGRGVSVNDVRAAWFVLLVIARLADDDVVDAVTIDVTSAADVRTRVGIVLAADQDETFFLTIQHVAQAQSRWEWRSTAEHETGAANLASRAQSE